MSDRASTAGPTDRPEKEPKRRTKTGCLTCRKRRVRCDEVHPVCSACVRLKLECVYPAPQPHLPHNLGRPPQTTDRPRPGRPRLSGSTQSADRPRNGRPRVSTTPSRERRRQTEGGLARSEDFDMGSGANSNMTGSSASPNVSASDASWLHAERKPSEVAKREPGPSYPEVMNGISAHMDPPKPVVKPGIPEGYTEWTWREDDNRPFTSEEMKYMERVKQYGIRKEDYYVYLHFHLHMVHFCPYRNATDDNLYQYIWRHHALFEVSLYNAMMAWSAFHYQKSRNREPVDADKRHDCAVERLQDAVSKGAHIDTILLTMWFLIEYERISSRGIDKVRSLLEHASAAVKEELGGDEKNALNRLGPMGSLALVWMCEVDCQMAQFDGVGRILHQLRDYPYIIQTIEDKALSSPIDMGKEWAENIKTHSKEELAELQSCMKLSLRTTFITGQVILFGRGQQPPSQADYRAAEAELERLENAIEWANTESSEIAKDIGEGRSDFKHVTLSGLAYNRLNLLAQYYVIIMFYQQHGPQNYRDSTQKEIRNITEGCALRVCKLAYRIAAGQPLIPPAMLYILFIAGTVVKDPIYQNWVLQRFDQAKHWGDNIRRAHKVLEHIVEQQNRTGISYDYVEVMKTYGNFII
ncbi:hypothetical protein BP6252_12682 [Coleophoma cylindrospora]|uniref:Zn(2)-C6 fungal-type domain-containing protein n=1 Tax=Coleophoma cylindrospora TaxID=1849047 RepID=A0A3D8QCL1_9HELO|nr:hypothetical protein BP6252_12682 [Coleophoma cylindrospora]